jgi:uncharacterized membrane protein
MPSIHKSIEIRAEPEKVFDLIARVEDFVHYSDAIREIRKIAPDTYHWAVQLGGFSFSWDAKVVEHVRPERFAWRSVRGVNNSGRYVLTPTRSGTSISFTMQYQLPNPLLAMLITPVLGPLIGGINMEILAAIKRQLEVESSHSETRRFEDQ